MMFLFRQQTAYAVRIGDWSSDVCSSDLQARAASQAHQGGLASQGKMESITDAAPGAVRPWFARYGLERMIHGHTKRPKVHHDDGGTRKHGTAQSRERACTAASLQGARGTFNRNNNTNSNREKSKG